MRNQRLMHRWMIPLFSGVVLFFFAQPLPAAEDAPAVTEEAPAASEPDASATDSNPVPTTESEKAQANYQKIADECIAETEEKLSRMGLIPSEESADYDAKFDDFYKDCMSAKGAPEAPLDDEGDSATPGQITE